MALFGASAESVDPVDAKNDGKVHQIFNRQDAMRTTVTIDDELYQRALEVAEPGMDKAELFREAMKVFVRVQAGKRLAALGGKVPTMKSISRRRPDGEPGR
jgi:Arc/MetJ family transcription regulator